MLRRIIYIVLIIGVNTKALAYGLFHHMWLGQETFEIWQDFDPSFYTALTTNDPNFQTWKELTRKMYYIGLTIPDLMLQASQPNNVITKLLSFLYSHKDTAIPWNDYIVYVWLVQALNIYSETFMRVQSPIPLTSNSHDFAVLKEMLLYARNELPDLYWNGFDIPEEPIKALIYGAYMHVIQDYIAHNVLQPASFGYGYVVEADSAKEYPLLFASSSFHSLYTDTYIPPYGVGFISTLFKGNAGPTPNLIYPGKEFYSQWTEGTWDKGWQDVVFNPQPNPIEGAIFYALNWFALIGQMKGYFNANINTDVLLEQIGSYLHGWGISLFFLGGYRENYEDQGGLILHPQWTGDDVLNFWMDLIKSQTNDWAEGVSHNLYEEIIINLSMDIAKVFIGDKVFKQKFKDNLPFDWEMVEDKVMDTALRITRKFGLFMVNCPRLFKNRLTYQLVS